MIYGTPTPITSSGLKYSGDYSNPGMYAIVKNVTNLYNYANNHQNLAGIYFTNCNTVTNAAYCCGDCYSLKEIINFPTSVTYAYSAFENCSNLKSFNIFNSNCQNWSRAFWNCSNLTSVNIYCTSSNYTNFCNAFYKCFNLKNVYFGNTKVNYWRMAFYSCTNLSYIDTIGPTPTTTNVFYQTFSGASGNIAIGNLYSQGLIPATNCYANESIVSVNKYDNTSGYIAFSDSNIAYVNYVYNVTNGYRMFYKASNLKYVNLAATTDTLTTASQMFYLSNNNILTENIVGFGINSKYDFSVLNNVSNCFYGTDQSRRVSSLYAGAINASNLTYGTSANTFIVNFPSATSINFTWAFGAHTISNLYINIPTNITPTLSNFANRTSTTRVNVYIPAGSSLNTAFYNNGTCPIGYLSNVKMTWTLNTDGSYYNTTKNVYVYPILNASSNV